MKTLTTKPLLLLLYGFPGAGKTFFARQFCEEVHAAHVQADRIRGELFETPRFDAHENSVVGHLMNYMTEEFLNAGISVVYDVNAMRSAQRHTLRDIARRAHSQPLLVWFQMDSDSAYDRNVRRDRRRADDKYAAAYDRTTFNQLIAQMQNPTNIEDYVVVSGKHTFNAQHGAVTRRLRDIGILTDQVPPLVKPGLVNLIPQPNPNRGRVDSTRRNIIIR